MGPDDQENQSNPNRLIQIFKYLCKIQLNPIKLVLNKLVKGFILQTHDATQYEDIYYFNNNNIKNNNNKK